MLMKGVAMSIGAPKGRKPLSAAALLRLVGRGFDHRPDPRCGAVEIALTEAFLAAVALFARKSPARLACDKARAAGH